MWFLARVSAPGAEPGTFDVEYEDDGNREAMVPVEELRLVGVDVAEDEAASAAPPKPLPLPLEGLLQLSGLIGGGGEEEDDDDVDGQEEGSGGGGGGKVPRTIVHRQQPRQRGRVDGDLRGEGKSAEDEDEVDGEGGAFVLEGGHDRLASGGGIRGIRFLRKSQRA